MTGLYEVTLSCAKGITDILIAELDQLGYEGFWHTSSGFKAFIKQSGLQQSALNELINKYQHRKIRYRIKPLKSKNWNEIWESNYPPIIIGNKFLIKAPFHTIEEPGLKTFIISPKMAFGTGHHATTELMVLQMSHIDFKGKRVLDYGTGTGILALVADHLGAADITAIDNDPAATLCARENFEKNNCAHVSVLTSDINGLSKEGFDIILANINRNILAETASALAKRLNPNGFLLISGFYERDINFISANFESLNIFIKSSLNKEHWAACLLAKN